MDDKILEILMELKESQSRIETKMKSMDNRLDIIESDIKDISNRLDQIQTNIKITAEDLRGCELATAQNSLEIAQMKMRIKMSQ